MRKPKKERASATQLITNSMRSTFINCRRRYWYTYEELLVPKQPSLPLIIGSAFHDALAAWYDGKSETKILTMADQYLKKYLKELLPPNLLEKIESSRGMLQGLLAAYFLEYADDKTKWEVVDIEQSFNVPTPQHPDWENGGKLDLVVREKGKTKLVEHKTTADLSVSYLDRLPLDSQIHHYFYAACKKYKPKPSEVIYNVAMKSRLRQKKDETWRQYIDRVRGDYELNPAKYFYRERLKIFPWMTKRYCEQLASSVTALARAREEGIDAFYMNDKHCFALGRCQFVPLCTEQHPEMALTQFVRGDTPHPELEED